MLDRSQRYKSNRALDHHSWRTVRASVDGKSTLKECIPEGLATADFDGRFFLTTDDCYRDFLGHIYRRTSQNVILWAERSREGQFSSLGHSAVRTPTTWYRSLFVSVSSPLSKAVREQFLIRRPSRSAEPLERLPEPVLCVVFDDLTVSDNDALEIPAEDSINRPTRGGFVFHCVPEVAWHGYSRIWKSSQGQLMETGTVRRRSSSRREQ